MDPDATLTSIRANLREYWAAPEGSIREAAASDNLANHVKALDDWLKKGGFLPAAWRAPSQLANTDAIIAELERHDLLSLVVGDSVRNPGTRVWWSECECGHRAEVVQANDEGAEWHRTHVADSIRELLGARA